jgi:hypothetical protein
MSSLPNLSLSAQNLVFDFRVVWRLERVNRHRVGLDTGIDAETQGVLVHTNFFKPSLAIVTRDDVSVCGWFNFHGGIERVGYRHRHIHQEETISYLLTQ